MDCLVTLPDAVAARRDYRIRGRSSLNGHPLCGAWLQVGALVGGNRVDGILLGRAPAHEEGEETVGLLGLRLGADFRIGLQMGRGIKLNGRFLFRAQNVLPGLEFLGFFAEIAAAVAPLGIARPALGKTLANRREADVGGKVESGSSQHGGHDPGALQIQIEHKQARHEPAHDAFDRNHMHPAPVPRQQAQDRGQEGERQQRADAAQNRRAVRPRAHPRPAHAAHPKGDQKRRNSQRLQQQIAQVSAKEAGPVAGTIVEEKGSRIFEVMLAVARPDDMLTGKLIGVGAVGLTQISIWVAAATLLSGSALLGPILSGDIKIHFTLLEGVLFPVYFLLGFFLYSAFFSGLAATCETAQDLQMYITLAVIPTWTSFAILPFLLNNPNSPWVIAASLFPPTAPLVMIPRIGMLPAPFPWWQIAASLALLIFSIWAVIWFASRLYRIGILMYGKRATLPELIRWLRYSG